MHKSIAAIGLAFSLSATGALAEASAPLPPARPAGVAKAQMLIDNTPLIVGLGIAAIVAVVIATNSNSNSSTTTTH
jgi:hypothetical protein